MVIQDTSLIFPENYFARWRELLPAHGFSGKMAWEAVETELYTETGLARYTSYESFRVGKARERKGFVLIVLTRKN